MSYDTTVKRINNILRVSYLDGNEKKKLAFASAVLILLSPQTAKEVLGITFEMPEIERAFLQKCKLTREQNKYLFHDCLHKAYVNGAHKVFEIFKEFENDMDSLKEYVALFTEDVRAVGAFSDSVNELGLKILATVNDKEQTIVDYCSGNGVLLSQAFLLGMATKLYGEEINTFNAEVITPLKLRAIGCNDYEIHTDDVICSPKFIGTHNRVFSNFPLGLYRSSDIQFKGGKYKGLNEIVSEGKIKNIYPDWKFINVLLNSISKNGKAIAITTTNRLSGPNDVSIRERLIKDGKVETVILFGNGVFINTNVATAMLVLSDNNKAPRLIDARNIISTKGKKQVLSKADVSKIFELYLDGKNGDDLTLVPTEKQMQEQDYSLSIVNYLDPLKDIKVTDTVVLGDVVDVQRGLVNVSRVNEERNDKNCYLVKIASIEDGNIDNLIEIGLDELEKCRDRELFIGDVLLAAKGTQTKAAIVTKQYDMPVFADQNILVLRPKKNLINGFYLNALINSEIGDKILKSAQMGDAIVCVSPNKARGLVIPVTSMDKQEKLAKVYTVATAEIYQLKEKLRIKKQERANLVARILEVK